MSVTWVDGARAERAVLPVRDRAVLLGDSVFEVLRAYRGAPFALREHLDRLARSAGAVRIGLPAGVEALEQEVRAAVAAFGAAQDAMVRVVLTRGELALGARLGGPAGARVVLVDPVRAPPAELYARGAAASVIAWPVVDPREPAAGAKYARYLPRLLALDDARARGADEALLCDGEGRVVEGATSNVMAVVGGALVTPPASAGILAGITRAHVLDLARAGGMDVREEPLHADLLAAASELMITSSLREVLPVARVDGRPVGGGQVGPVAPRLRAALRARAGASDQTA